MDWGEKHLYAVMRLIRRYDYDGAIEIFDLLGQQGTPLYQFVLSCHRSLNFNFLEAQTILDDAHFIDQSSLTGIKRHVRELPHLISGDPEYIFSELLCNIQIKRDRQDYTDFLGRIFQLRELLLKYAVIQLKEGITYSLRDRIYEKQAFENHFKLRHGLMNGMKEILKQGSERWQRISHILTGKAMSELMDLRHQTIVAHGIDTASLKDITRIYESPEKLMSDLAEVLRLLSIEYKPFKYQEVNRDLIGMLKRDLPLDLKFREIPF